MFTVNLYIYIAGRYNGTAAIDASMRLRPLVKEHGLGIDYLAVAHPEIVLDELMIAHQTTVGELQQLLLLPVAVRVHCVAHLWQIRERARIGMSSELIKVKQYNGRFGLKRCPPPRRR